MKRKGPVWYLRLVLLWQPVSSAMHLQKFCETDFLVSPIESKPYLSKRSEPGKRFKKIFEKTMTSPWSGSLDQPSASTWHMVNAFSYVYFVVYYIYRHSKSRSSFYIFLLSVINHWHGQQWSILSLCPFFYLLFFLHRVPPQLLATPFDPGYHFREEESVAFVDRVLVAVSCLFLPRIRRRFRRLS